jgi:hypothetical protein
VHADPGVYSAATNGEFLPVRMRNYVHVQGTGARQCVLRGNGTQTNVNVFYPTANCICGARNLREVLLDLNSTFTATYEEMFDGFTFEGGDVQVYADGEVNITVRISNCVFDMLDYSDAGVAGPTFGVLMVHVYDPSGYRPDPLNILNNTFIQGWTPSYDYTQMVVARPDAVAICDVNDPLCGYPFPDPNPTLRGLGKPSIQNNLIRFAAPVPRTALLGVNDSDTRVIVGNPTGPTNAFDPGTALSLDLSGSYCSQILGATPVPKVNPNPFSGGTDPGFVGEMLSSLFGQPLGVSRDWRILPDSVLVNAGSNPVHGVLQARNLTAYREPTLMPISSFDFDGEVYGNPRIVRVVDIGFDETSILVDCAGWANDSVNHFAGCALACSANNGQAVRAFVFPSGGIYSLFETRVPIPVPPPFSCPSGFYWAYTTMPGTIVPPITVAGFLPPWNLQWMNSALITNPIVNAPVAPVAGYVPPFDATAHAFGIAGMANTGTCGYMNEQAIFTPTGGTAVVSNVQSFTE